MPGLTAPTPFRLGDRVELRRPHPCGGRTWDVDRLGADIGLRCQRCGRRVLLDRTTVEKRLKLFVSRAEEPREVMPGS